MKIKLLPLIVFLSCLLLTDKPPNFFAQEPTPSAELPEVIIKGGDKKGIEGEKPPLQIEVDSQDPVKSILEPEEDVLRRQPDSIRTSRVGFTEILSNMRTILPSRKTLVGEPVKIFYPLKEIFSSDTFGMQEIGKGWEIVISDSEGQQFRKFSGKSLPPAELSWDGRGAKGEMLTPGKNYSLVITYKDSRRQSRNFVGKPFSYEGIVHQEIQGLTISLAANALFQPKGDLSENETISEKGMNLLEESADLIKRYHFNSPVKVEFISKDPKIAQARAEKITHILESILLRPQGEITFQTPAPDIESEYAKIIIVNR